MAKETEEGQAMILTSTRTSSYDSYNPPPYPPGIPPGELELAFLGQWRRKAWLQHKDGRAPPPDMRQKTCRACELHLTCSFLDVRIVKCGVCGRYFAALYTAKVTPTQKAYSFASCTEVPNCANKRSWTLIVWCAHCKEGPGTIWTNKANWFYKRSNLTCVIS